MRNNSNILTQVLCQNNHIYFLVAPHLNLPYKTVGWLRFQVWNLTSPYWKTPIWLIFSWLKYNITSQHPLKRKRWWQQEGLSSKKNRKLLKAFKQWQLHCEYCNGFGRRWNWLKLLTPHEAASCCSQLVPWLMWSAEFWLAHFECGRQVQSHFKLLFFCFCFLMEHPFLNIIYGMFARLICEI